MVYHKTIAALCMCALFMLGLAGSAHADNITELQKMHFGRWMVTNNTASRSLTVGTNGSYSSSPALIMLSPPQPGVYQVTGLPPFHVVGSVDVTVNQQLQGSGPDFTVDNFTTVIPTASSAGVTTLTLGATAHTSGTGVGYPNDTYNGELHIEINL